MAEWALGDLAQELASTRRCLERIPDEKWDWAPHEKSWTMGQLATHLARLPLWPQCALERSELDIAALPKSDATPSDRVSTLALFDARTAALLGAMASADDALLQRPWTLRMGERALMTIPTVASVRMWGISHLIHHRGQLTVYLRLAGAAVPGLYGPSADER